MLSKGSRASVGDSDPSGCGKGIATAECDQSSRTGRVGC